MIVVVRRLLLGLVGSVAVAGAQAPGTARVVRVIEQGTSRPISGARLVIGGRTLIAGADGRIAVPPAADAPPWVVRQIGFRPDTLRAVPTAAETTITLTPVALALDALVVTSARREQKLKDVVVTTELITRADIERSGASDLASILTEATGIQLDGGVPTGAGVLLQGLGAQRVLIMLDGQPLVGRVNGNFDISRLSAAMVERIEVVKGPQSTLYGSEAMGGVINIISRPPSSGTSAAVAFTSGSQERRDGAVHLDGTRGRAAAAIDLGRRYQALTPGVSATNGTFSERWDVAPRVTWRVDDALTFNASALVVDERQRYRTGQFFQFSDNVQLAARAGADWTQGVHRIRPLVHIAQFSHLSRRSTSTLPVAGTGDDDRQTLAELEVTYSGALRSMIIDGGVELRHERITADRVRDAERSLDGIEPYAQLTWTAGPLTLVPGARVSWNQQWGTYLTPRLAALWRTNDRWAVRGALARGYRAPDFKELYINFVNVPAGYAVEGNPALTPETSRNLQLGVEYTSPSWYTRVTMFDNGYRDFIETGAQDANGIFTYSNVARGMTRGGDVDAAIVRGASRVEVGYAYLWSRDARTGGALLGRAPHSGRLTASHAWRAIRVSATGLVTASTATARDSAGTVTARQPTFGRLDLRIARPLVAGSELSVGVDNVFDRSLGPEWPGFTGRQWYATVSWQGSRSR